MTNIQTKGILLSDAASNRVLVEVISSNPDNLKKSISMVKTRGWEVSVVFRLHEAVSRAELLRPDIVLFFVKAEEYLTAAETCLHIRRTEGNRPNPLIFVILEPKNKHMRRRFFELGAADCLSCGDDPEEIALKFDVMLDKRFGGNPNSENGIDYHDKDSLVVNLISQYLRNRIEDDITVEDIETEFSIGRRQLNRSFQDQTGMTMIEWHRQMKLEHARSLICSSNASITEISEILGYSSVCNFSTAFRNRYHLSPREFRAKTQLER